MSGLLNKTGRLGLLVVFALAFFVAAFFYFYRGSYDAPPTPQIPVDSIDPPTSQLRAFDESPLIQKGTLLVDGIHGNSFSKRELAVLLNRVADRGYEVEFMGEARRFGGFSSLSTGNRLDLMEEKLRRADSLLVVLPGTAYSKQEADLIEQYVLRKGGKVLLVSDPTRRNNINSLAERFGVTFQSDYLYNTTDYDLNFQNVFIRDFRTDAITEGLEQIVLYTAGSVKSSLPGLAFTDENTRSSMLKQPDPFQPMVKSGEGRVLALSDLTFMIPPRNSVQDNDRLISNIADYLTASERSFDLADFPSFFKGDVDILLGRSVLFDVAADLKGMLSEFRTGSDLQAVEDITKDTVYLGLYEDSPDVAQYLEVAGIGLDEVLRTPFTPDIEQKNTAIILLNPGRDRHALVILGDSESSLRDAVFLLSSGRFRSGLVGDFVGIYRTR